MSSRDVHGNQFRSTRLNSLNIYEITPELFVFTTIIFHYILCVRYTDKFDFERVNVVLVQLKTIVKSKIQMKIIYSVEQCMIVTGNHSIFVCNSETCTYSMFYTFYMHRMLHEQQLNTSFSIEQHM